jgi:hypothetical protein
MTIKSDPLTVLLKVRAGMDTMLDDELVRACYQIQSDQQYDKERDTMIKMKNLIEEMIIRNESDVLL